MICGSWPYCPLLQRRQVVDQRLLARQRVQRPHVHPGHPLEVTWAHHRRWRPCSHPRRCASRRCQPARSPVARPPAGRRARPAARCGLGARTVAASSASPAAAGRAPGSPGRSRPPLAAPALGPALQPGRRAASWPRPPAARELAVVAGDLAVHLSAVHGPDLVGLAEVGGRRTRPRGSRPVRRSLRSRPFWIEPVTLSPAALGRRRSSGGPRGSRHVWVSPARHERPARHVQPEYCLAGVLLRVGFGLGDSTSGMLPAKRISV